MTDSLALLAAAYAALSGSMAPRKAACAPGAALDRVAFVLRVDGARAGKPETLALDLRPAAACASDSDGSALRRYADAAGGLELWVRQAAGAPSASLTLVAADAELGFVPVGKLGSAAPAAIASSPLSFPHVTVEPVAPHRGTLVGRALLSPKPR